MTSPSWPPPNLGVPTKPPYNLDKLNPPLTKTQRAALLHWAQRNGYTLPAAISDADLIARCKDLAAGNIAGTPSIGNRVAGIGEGAFDYVHNTLNVAEFLGRLAAAIFDPAFWLRFAEVVIGALLVGVGVAHLSPRAGAAVKSIPLYGAAIGKAMPK